MSVGKVQGLSNEDELGKLILDGKQFDARLDGSVVSSSLERTIDAASTLTLTVDDPERFLQGGRYYERRADLLYDDLWFRMVTVEKQPGDLFTLTFEDREVAILRTMTKPRRMSRANATRAQFLQALVKEVGHIGFVCPELDKKQPIGSFTKSDQQTLQRNHRRGIPLTAKFKIQGVQADRTQIRNLNIALNVAESLGAGHLATMGMLFAGIGESGWKDIMQGNFVPVENFKKSPHGPWGHTSGYGGCLQGQVFYSGPGAVNWFRSMSPAERTLQEATSFMQGGRGYQGGGAMKIAKAHPSIDPGKIADTVEGAPYSGHYGHHAEAQKIIDLYGGIDNVASSDNGSGRAYVKQYEFSRGAPAGPKGEDTWACGQRLASEVQWRWFIVAGNVHFVSDYDLIRSQKAVLLDEDSAGIEDISYHLDVSPRVPSTVTITCRATRWVAPPGTVVGLTENMGPVAGAWIVSDIVRNDLTDEQTTVTLTTVETPKKEPASQVLLRSSIPSKDGGTLTGPDTGRTLSRELSQVGNNIFTNPLLKIQNLQPLRIDMGVDYSGSGPLLAIADGEIVSTHNSGWPGGAFIEIKLADGKFWYYAENITPTVSVGDKVKAGQPIGTLHDAYPYCEMGWSAGTGGTTLAARLGQQAHTGDPGSVTTAVGLSANRLLVQVGAPSGKRQGTFISGKTPAGYP